MEVSTPQEGENGGGNSANGQIAHGQSFLCILVVIAVGVVLYVGQVVWIPILGAVLVNLLFKPLVLWLQRWKIPPVVTAWVITSLIFLSLCLCAYQIGAPAVRWIDNGPQYLREIRYKVRDMSGFMEKIDDLAEEMDRSDEPEKVQKVQVKDRTLGVIVVSQGLTVIVMLLAWLILCFFFLAAGDHFLRRLVHLMPDWARKRQAVETMLAVRDGVSQYLIVRTVINIGLGVAIALSLAWMNVPNTIAWGMAAAILNYIPYAGPLVFLIYLTGVTLLQFETAAEALAPPIVCFLLNVIEANLVCPWAFGRRTNIHASMTFIGLLFWGWLWSVAGALMAVPIMLAMRITLERIPSLRFIADFISQHPDPGAPQRRND